MRAPLLAALAVASALAWPIGAEQQGDQAPVFRAGTETVAIYATVLDRYGEMMLNLSKDDFEVFDDGRRQELTVFESGLRPISAILLVDTSASMTLNLDLAKMAAEQFVIRLLPGDQARVGSFSERLSISPTFTGDRDALLRSLRNGLDIGNPTKLWDALDQTMAELEPLGGRRIIMVLTDGMDTASRLREDAVMDRARGDEVMIYIVQFRTTARANLAEFPVAPSASDVFSGDDRMRFRPPTEAIRRLTMQTGGSHFMLGQADDVNATFTSLMQELHYQYALGFTPQRLDGRVHELQIRLRRPNLFVRARQTYVARAK